MGNYGQHNPSQTKRKVIDAKGSATGRYHLSEMVVTACLEGAIRKLDWEKAGLRIIEEYLSHLTFAQ